MKKKIGTINLTPKWMDVYPTLCEMIDNGTPRQKAYVKEELRRLCEIMDETRAKLISE